MKDRKLLQYIPFFRIEGEADPFRNIDKNAVISIALLRRRLSLDEVYRTRAEFERFKKRLRNFYWISGLTVLLAVSSFIIWLWVRWIRCKKTSAKKIDIEYPTTALPPDIRPTSPANKVNFPGKRAIPDREGLSKDELSPLTAELLAKSNAGGSNITFGLPVSQKFHTDELCGVAAIDEAA